MKRKKLTSYKFNNLQHFLLACSGANLNILRKTPSEWNKFAGIGGVILFTSLFATLSAGYALFTVFDNLWAAAAFGILWGLMIFNLDRYIVSSIKKTGTFWNQFLMATPRILLAAFLGIIISKPLELKVFEKEINKQLNTIVERNKADIEKQMNSRILKQTEPFEQEKKQIQEKTAQYQAAFDSAAVELEKEILGTKTTLTSGKEGFGPNAKRKAELKNQRYAELQNYRREVQPRLNALDSAITKVYDNLEKSRSDVQAVEEGFNGFAARLQALDELGSNSKIMATASLFIMGLFIALEIAPVLVKLISPVGPYDYLLDQTENEYRLYSKELMTKSERATERRIEEFRSDS